MTVKSCTSYRILPSKRPSPCKSPPPFFDDPMVRVYMRYTYKWLLCVNAPTSVFWLVSFKCHGRLIGRLRYLPCIYVPGPGFSSTSPARMRSMDTTTGMMYSSRLLAELDRLVGWKDCWCSPENWVSPGCWRQQPVLTSLLVILSSTLSKKPEAIAELRNGALIRSWKGHMWTHQIKIGNKHILKFGENGSWSWPMFTWCIRSNKVRWCGRYFTWFYGIPITQTASNFDNSYSTHHRIIIHTKKQFLV